ncbi:hypothetical protein Y032_0131g1605 [Ancylostoma ceylanicum]|nr:hypothetical protein Y032_0131g1605 [Ancylostoma ceylanicum]
MIFVISTSNYLCMQVFREIHGFEFGVGSGWTTNQTSEQHSIWGSTITRLFENINRILFIAVLVLAVHYIANLWLSNHDAIPQEKAQMRLRAFENELSKFATEFGNITREELRFLFHVGRQSEQRRPNPAPLMGILTSEGSHLS